MKKLRGFTLIELMIVIAIIGILATITITPAIAATPTNTGVQAITAAQPDEMGAADQFALTTFGAKSPPLINAAPDFYGGTAILTIGQQAVMRGGNSVIKVPV